MYYYILFCFKQSSVFLILLFCILLHLLFISTLSYFRLPWFKIDVFFDPGSSSVQKRVNFPTFLVEVKLPSSWKTKKPSQAAKTRGKFPSVVQPFYWYSSIKWPSPFSYYVLVLFVVASFVWLNPLHFTLADCTSWRCTEVCSNRTQSKEARRNPPLLGSGTESAGETGMVETDFSRIYLD